MLLGPELKLCCECGDCFFFFFFFFGGGGGGVYVAFNTVQVISRRVVGRAEETST